MKKLILSCLNTESDRKERLSKALMTSESKKGILPYFSTAGFPALPYSARLFLAKIQRCGLPAGVSPGVLGQC
jgi:hypothetical protein